MKSELGNVVSHPQVTLRRIARKLIRVASDHLRHNVFSNAYRSFYYRRHPAQLAFPHVTIVWSDSLNIFATDYGESFDQTACLARAVDAVHPLVLHLTAPTGELSYLELNIEGKSPSAGMTAAIWDGRRQEKRHLEAIPSKRGVNSAMRLDLSGFRVALNTHVLIAIRPRSSSEACQVLVRNGSQVVTSQMLYRDVQGRLAYGQEVLAYSLRWQDEDRLYENDCWLMPQDEQRLQPRPIFANHPLCFKVVMPAAEPLTLDSLLFTYGRDNDGVLHIAIETEDGVLIREANLPTSGLVDGKKVRLVDLRGLDVAPGRPLIVKISSTQALGSCIALPVTTVPEGRYSTRIRAIDYRNDRSFLPYSTARSDTIAIVACGHAGLSAAFLNHASRVTKGIRPLLLNGANLEKEWQHLLASHCVIFFASCLDRFEIVDFEALCFALHRRGILTIFADATFEERRQFAMNGDFAGLTKEIERRSMSCAFRYVGDAVNPTCFDTLTQEDISVNCPLTVDDLDMLSTRIRQRRNRSVDVVLVHSNGGVFDVDLSGLMLAEGQILTLIPVGGTVRAAGSGWPSSVEIQPAESFVEAVASGNGEIIMIAERDGAGLGVVLAEHLFEHYCDEVDVVAPRKSFTVSDSIIEGGLDRVSIKRHRTLKELLEVAAWLPDAAWSSVRAGLELSLSVYRRAGVVRKTYSGYSTSIDTPVPVDLIADISAKGDAETRLLLHRLSNVGRTTLSAPAVDRRAPLRILTYRWHAPHQYELQRLPADFTLVSGLNGMPAFEQWPYNQRPKRTNVTVVPWSEIKPQNYDLALLHFDENILIPSVSNGNLPPGWGQSARWLAELGLPLIGLCHGTPPFVGQYGVARGPIKAFEQIESARRQLVAWFAAMGAPVVCNSFQAKAEWDFKDSHVFWHGFDPLEFPQATLQRDVLVVGGNDRPHYRGFYEEEIVRAHLRTSIRVQGLPPVLTALEQRDGNPFAVRQFRNYVDQVRTFSFYLNTTLRSPMPRSRGEAMMTGVIPVCLRNHDVDMFIEQGVDGFYADQPEDLAEFLNETHSDRDKIARMSKAARLKAFDLFNHDRNLSSWIELIDKVIA
ncbi:glycosyltransferase [Rhizobium sp. 57MFTsu3.2]|uniref:glycosyltransferase n=1 Tax=Rhizobium sp. 57MFTsu3.2 TaxID=1048681 RepID=UPI001AED9B59|nr:glycosyltransferase [Rhizobium sp. 57MFTsu3.2]